MYKRVLLKLSGEALSDGIKDPFSKKHLDDVVEQIAKGVEEGVQIGIVTGGGNIYRGKIGETLGMDRVIGDSIGMLATVMNCLALSNSLSQHNVKNIILSAVEIAGVAELFTYNKAMKALHDGFVVLYCFGTGHPYFSTDTCAALRAVETKCDAILVAKNGVDGIYSADPKFDKTATKFDEITYSEILDRNLKVMDLTAISLCKDNNMPLFVFDMNKEDNVYKAFKNEVKGTIVK